VKCNKRQRPHPPHTNRPPAGRGRLRPTPLEYECHDRPSGQPGDGTRCDPGRKPPACSIAPGLRGRRVIAANRGTCSELRLWPGEGCGRKGDLQFIAPASTRCRFHQILGRSEIGWDSARLSLLNGQFPNLQWLRERGCDLDAPIGKIDARLSWMLESKDPSGAVANDYAAYYSRWGVSRESVEDTRAKLSGFRGAP
jgi:hypothetical protein